MEAGEEEGWGERAGRAKEGEEAGREAGSR